jgi:hypothetical protein
MMGQTASEIVLGLRDRIELLEAALKHTLNTIPVSLYDTHVFGEELKRYRLLVGLTDPRKG